MGAFNAMLLLISLSWQLQFSVNSCIIKVYVIVSLSASVIYQYALRTVEDAK